MYTYGYLAVGMTLLSIFMSFYQSPSWLIGGAFSAYISWQLLAKSFQENACISITKGRIISIKANGTFLGGEHQPLFNSEVAYLDRIKLFKNLPPNFIHDYAPGDIIEIKYNPKKPNTAFVNFL